VQSVLDGFQDFQMILLKKRAGHFFDLFEKKNLISEFEVWTCSSECPHVN